MKNFKWDKKYLYWGIVAFSVVVASIIFFHLVDGLGNVMDGIETVLGILRPFVFGVIIAYLVNHLLRPLENKVFLKLAAKYMPKKPVLGAKLARIVSIICCDVAVLAVVSALLVTVLPQITVSIIDLINKSQSYVEILLGWVEEFLDGNDILEPVVRDWINSFYSMFVSWLRTDVLPQMATLISQITGGVISVVKVVFSLVVGLVVSIYILYSKETFGAQSKKLIYSIFEVKTANKVMEEIKFIDEAFGAYLAGALLDAGIVGVVNYIFMMSFGMPYPTLIAIILAMTNLIPMFGPFIGAIPCGLIILLESPSKCLIFAIFTVILQQVDGNIIVPRIHSSKSGISGFWVLFAITVFGGLFGMMGMIIGVPVMTVLYSWFRRLNNRNLRVKGLPENTQDYMSLDYIDEETGKFVYKEKAETVPPSPSGENRKNEENKGN